jgi:hypothetical protein
VALAPIPLDPALDPDPQALRAGLWDAVVAGLQMGGCVFLCAGIVGTLRARYGVPIVVIDPVPVPRTTTVPARVPVEISA